MDDGTWDSEKGVTPTQRLLRCFAELDAAQVNADATQNKEDLLQRIRSQYGLTQEEAQMVIEEKTVEYENANMDGNTRLKKTKAGKFAPLERKRSEEQIELVSGGREGPGVALKMRRTLAMSHTAVAKPPGVNQSRAMSAESFEDIGSHSSTFNKDEKLGDSAPPSAVSFGSKSCPISKSSVSISASFPPMQHANAQQNAPSRKPASEMEDLLIDPISHEMMVEPVVLPCGHSFSQHTLAAWLRTNSRCPLCNRSATILDAKPNLALSNIISHVSTKIPAAADGGRGLPLLLHSGWLEEPKVSTSPKESATTIYNGPLSPRTAKHTDEEIERGVRSKKEVRKMLKEKKKQLAKLKALEKSAQSAVPPRISKNKSNETCVFTSEELSDARSQGLHEDETTESEGEDATSSSSMSSPRSGNGSENEESEEEDEEADESGGPQLELQLISEFGQVAYERTHTIRYVAHIKAPVNATFSAPTPVVQNSTVPSTSGNARAGVMLVAVIDRSSSMRGRMHLVKAALGQMLAQLNDSDWMAVISYDGSVCVEAALTNLTPMGKRKVSKAIESIDTGFWTNLSGGLSSALKLLRNFGRPPEAGNVVSSILLFTDGQPNKGLVDSKEILVEADKGLRRLKQDNCVIPSIFTFGFGSSPDAELLSNLAELSKGVYYAIEKEEDIQSAFGDCLGGLLSICAEKLVLTLEPLKGARIAKVYDTNFLSESTQPKSTSSSSTLILGDIYHEETRNILLSITVPALSEPTENCIILRARLRYIPLPGGKHRKVQFEHVIARPATSNIFAESLKVSELVDKQHNRIITARTIRKALAQQKKGNYGGAVHLLTHGVSRIQDSVSGSDPYSSSLIDNLNECMRRVLILKQGAAKSQPTEKPNNTNDFAYQHSLALIHSRQRGTHSLTTYNTRAKDSFTKAALQSAPSKSKSSSNLGLTEAERALYILDHIEKVLEHIKKVFAVMDGVCTPETCPKMCAGPSFEYLWKDEHCERAVVLPASHYIGRLLPWAQEQLRLSREDVAKQQSRLGSNYKSSTFFVRTTKDAMRRLFRVYAHVFHHHLQYFQAEASRVVDNRSRATSSSNSKSASTARRLESYFVQFVALARQFSLCSDDDMQPLRSFIRTLKF